MKKPVLEIACFNVESVGIALEGGADRIEFCRDYRSGGLTPFSDDLRKISNYRQQVFVMIRPRKGGFNYSKTEFEQMKQGITQVKELEFAGVVFGLLNEKNEIDLLKTKELVVLSRPMQVTFHRAFDRVNDQEKGLEQLIEMGIERVLTSGKAKTAVEGTEQLKKLNKQANGRIIILAGGGIRSENVSRMLECGISEIHSSGILSGETCNKSETEKIKKIIAPFAESE